MQGDCALRIACRGRLTMFSVEYKTSNQCLFECAESFIKKELRQTCHYAVFKDTCRSLRGAIAYNTLSALVSIHGTMTDQRYVHDILQPHVLPLMQRLPGAIFQQDNARRHTARDKTVFVCYYPSLAYPMPIFVSNQAYLGSFGAVIILGITRV
ncbi:uncharacterized protein TNCV_4303411 [Trichonephila clavipes]|nr:uncharacterized protein TNCV_4303411 [Trichonephila clavipes]